MRSLASCPPTAASAPAGRPFSEPRVRSPARATKPWVRPCPQSRSPAGATRSTALCHSTALFHSAALSYRAAFLSRVVRGRVLCPDSCAPWPVAWRRGKPQRGDPSQSPGCVALQGQPNPGFVRAHNPEALQGRPNPGFARVHNPEALQERPAERLFATARPFSTERPFPIARPFYPV